MIKAHKPKIPKYELQSYTELMYAAATNDYNRVIDTVMTYARQFSTNGYTALMLSILNGNLEIAEFLTHYEAGCIHEKNRSALMISVDKGHYNIAKLLISEARLFDRDNKSALYYVIKQGFPDQDKNFTFYSQLLQRESDQYFSPGYYNTLGLVIQNSFTIQAPLLQIILDVEGLKPCNCNSNIFPLQYAAINNNSQIVDMMLEKFNTQQLLAQSPLHALAKHDLTFQINKFGKFLKARNVLGETALMICCQSKSKNPLEFLTVESKMKTVEGKTALMYAAKSQFSQGVDILLSIEGNMKDEYDKSALCYLAENQQLEMDKNIAYKMIFKLVEKDKKAIEICIQENNTEMFRLLSKHSKDNYMHAALKYNFPEAMVYYKNFDPILDENLNTLLMTAQAQGQSQYVNHYIDQINAQNVFGETALIIAVKRLQDYEKIHPELLKESNILDYARKSALEYALEQKKFTFARLLKDSVDTIDWRGRNIVGRSTGSLMQLFSEKDLSKFQGKKDYFNKPNGEWILGADIFGRVKAYWNRLIEVTNEQWLFVEE
ncbi:Ankyrin_repeat protein 2 [Hexamita inflata]|uniref:Ankyrin repeat protein 2 n=1 Tax=Hexamita inflata TaxID=28002 RepID=A0AA86PC13_9EUKA|nr:Ankyrin repeat protein 2 [Hexamita inflata]CAI9958725.1 Ankyrin repeat protein 2 [Hexamita inflata]CAI9963042.1 Ankyrin repeat protein 2 [Hexamita inflata]